MPVDFPLAKAQAPKHAAADTRWHKTCLGLVHDYNAGVVLSTGTLKHPDPMKLVVLLAEDEGFTYTSIQVPENMQSIPTWAAAA